MTDASAHFDLQVIQCGEIYTVTGKSALALYEKLQTIPAPARTLTVGTFKNGSFTMRKIEERYIGEGGNVVAKPAASGA